MAFLQPLLFGSTFSGSAPLCRAFSYFQGWRVWQIWKTSDGSLSRIDKVSTIAKGPPTRLRKMIFYPVDFLTERQEATASTFFMRKTFVLSCLTWTQRRLNRGGERNLLLHSFDTFNANTRVPSYPVTSILFVISSFTDSKENPWKTKEPHKDLTMCPGC